MRRRTNAVKASNIAGKVLRFGKNNEEIVAKDNKIYINNEKVFEINKKLMEFTFLDNILAIKTVDSINEAIDFINQHNTHHSETIITSCLENANLFQNKIDAACVYVNASTRFTDGGEFGFGAELGISTQKLHARGPMGLSVLTTTKYFINGEGQIR